jgi:hypothetical protein
MTMVGSDADAGTVVEMPTQSQNEFAQPQSISVGCNSAGRPQRRPR